MKNDEARIKMLIGERIRKRRLNKGLTQENLAEILDVSTRYISQVERGETNPALNRFIHFANALEVDVFDLLTDDNTDEIIHLYNLLSERDREIVKSIILKMLST